MLKTACLLTLEILKLNMDLQRKGIAKKKKNVLIKKRGKRKIEKKGETIL